MPARIVTSCGVAGQANYQHTQQRGPGVKPLLLIGGGGHCHACIDVIESDQKYRIAGIVLPTRGDHADVMGYPVIGADEDLSALLAKTPNAIVTVGQIKSTAIRIKLFELLKAHGSHLPIIQSPF